MKYSSSQPRSSAAWRWHIYVANSQMILVAVFENGWGPDELAAKPGHVLDLNGRRNGLESQLVSILAEATQAANGKQAIAGSTRLPASFYRVSCARVDALNRQGEETRPW